MAAAATMSGITHSWPQTREQFGELVEALQQGLVRYAFARLGSLPEAEDAVQDVLVRAWLGRSAHPSAPFASGRPLLR
jgi:DNA-directed RNA polymerase specialized sigma24 family protein